MSSQDETPAAATCPLPPAGQHRNLFVFAACTGLQYLAAPVLYVGITQADLCEQLGANTRVANLPATFYFAMTAMPALVVWLFPYVRHLKRVLSVCYAAMAVVMLLAAAALASDVPARIKIAAVILQGAVCGAAGPTAIALLWEVIGRGTDEGRRGQALGLAFGVGPVLAVIGSVGQSYLLGGTGLVWGFEGLGYPTGHIWLFGLGAPVMAIGSFLGGICVVPEPESEPPRKPIADVMSLCVGLALGFTALGLFFAETAPEKDPAAAKNGVAVSNTSSSAGAVQSPDSEAQNIGWKSGLGFALLVAASIAIVYHFRDILSQRVLLLATIVTILVYSGNTIPSNMTLYAREVLKIADPGLQNTLRFSFKVVTGLFLGWLLTKSNPRAGVLVTAGLFVIAQLWAIAATGKAYLVAFGIFGAGELIGVYAVNYILSASRKEDYRRAMAFVTMLMVPAAPTGYMYGAIVDALKEPHGAAFAFRTSFAVCAALIVSGIVLALVALPARPNVATDPPRED